MLKTFSGHVLKTSLRRLKDQHMFAGTFFDFKQLEMKQNSALQLYDTLYDTFYNHSFCDILINVLRVTSYELISLRVAFIAQVTSYELLFIARVTSYCILH